MKMTEIIPLPSASPGSQNSMAVFRYGKRGSGPKVYIQAGLHADEAPGFLVAYHLEKLLNVSEVNGEIILVPLANPIGLSQWRDDNLQGRFHCTTSINFNRQHLELHESVAQKVEKQLDTNAEKNVLIIRRCIKEVIDEVHTEDDVDYLKKQLFTLAYDADIVLDLHCDQEALLHLYMGTPLWPEASDLAAHLGAEVILLAKNSGDNPFDEACSRIWWELASAFPHKPIPPACLSATLEFRGAADTDQELAQKDALNIIRFLQHRKIIGGRAPHTPPLKQEATPLTGVDYVTATEPGIVVFSKKLGEKIKQGDIIAEIVNPFPKNDERRIHALKSNTDGILFTRISDRFAYPGRILAKIAGKKPLRCDSGNLLTL